MSSGPPTAQEIRKIARRTIDIIEDCFGVESVCLIGSAAAALWTDIGRVPKDVDTLVTPPRSEGFDAEEIKQAIVDADGRYYLRPSKRPGATYKVLFCRLPGWRVNRRHVKVDILLPVRPRLWIPRVLSRDTYIFNGITVTPLFDLFVIKMQGWRDHKASRRADFCAKVEADISDIRALLDRCLAQEMSYQDEKRHRTRGFMARAHRLALSFVEMCGERAKFQALGFPDV